ncbi:hypothetical protein Syun_015436 [Stephania yunnanensis]|uniref:BED-type domain-containing protein n=1 Tax=Stephania yunnanensis TaxID=152371 RepID=A0AAP0PCT8_9MAGN
MIFILYYCSVMGDNMHSIASNHPQKKRKNQSKVWDDFTVISSGTSEYPDNRKRGKCKHCMIVVLADGNNGTNGMKRHLSSCPNYSRFGNHDVGQMILESSVTGNMRLRSVNYDFGIHRENMAMIVIMHELPFTFVDYEYVKYSYTSLVPEIKCVSRNTVKADILKIYKREKRKLFNSLQSLPGRVCLTSDMWTSITSDGYITLTAHYIDEDWVLQKRILNFCFMPPPHSGVAIAEKISALLGSWNLDKKLFSITLDNASANDTFVGIFKNTLRIKDALLVGGNFFHM